MLYLLAASAEWLAAALVIGLVVGWLTTTPAKGARFSGQGVVVAAAFLLAGGFLLVNLQTLPGRAGLLLEMALLLASAYGVGLPIGGGARLLTSAAFPAPPAKKKPPLVVVRGAPPNVPVREAALVPPALVSSPVETAPASAPPPPAETEKKLPGLQPAGLPKPREGKPDDLTKIKGVGPKSVEKLHALGVYHFDQIAAWTPENVKWIGASLAVPGRLERGRWVAQAKELTSAGQGTAGSADVSARAGS